MSPKTGARRGRPEKISKNPDQLSLEYQDREIEYFVDDQLSPLQNAFVNAYANSGNGVKSYLQVYMPGVTEPTKSQYQYAAERASDMRRLPKISKALTELFKQRQQKTQLTADKIISSLWDLYNAGISGIKHKRKIGDSFEKFTEYNLNTALGAIKELKTHKSVASEFKASSDVTVNLSLSERMKRIREDDSDNG
jgi:hypothetical protein